MSQTLLVQLVPVVAVLGFAAVGSLYARHLNRRLPSRPNTPSVGSDPAKG